MAQLALLGSYARAFGVSLFDRERPGGVRYRGEHLLVGCETEGWGARDRALAGNGCGGADSLDRQGYPHISVQKIRWGGVCPHDFRLPLLGLCDRPLYSFGCFGSDPSTVTIFRSSREHSISQVERFHNRKQFPEAN